MKAGVKKTPRSVGITAFLVRLSGFEPLAFRLGGGRSILLSYRNLRVSLD